VNAPEDFDVCQTGSRKILDENALRIAELEEALRRLISLPVNEKTDSLFGYAGAVRAISREALLGRQPCKQ